MYPKLNITNIVENNEPVEIPNWCAPGENECTEKRSVVPYRCLGESKTVEYNFGKFKFQFFF